MGEIAAIVLVLAIAWVLFVPAAGWLARHTSAQPRDRYETALDNARGRLLTLGTAPRLISVFQICTLLIGEGFDWPVEKVTARAPDHRAFKRPAGRVHDVPAHHRGGKPAPYISVCVHECGTVKKRNLSFHRSPPLATRALWTAL
jgi:hypothetical protein